MRVIAGTARSMPLKTVTGLDTRPTTDRIKETLFNMLQSEIHGSCFLDLYAGSGGIGIEALSRGACRAVFVDNSNEAVKCIKDNLKFTKLDKNAEVIEADVLTAIKRLSGRGCFDIVYMDAPYEQGFEEKALKYLAESDIIDGFTTIIAEEAIGADFSFAEEAGFEISKVKNYKTNKHIFLKLKS